MFIGALYHPPKPQYQPAALLDYIEAGVDAVTAAFPSAAIVLAGDFNSLDARRYGSGDTQRPALHCRPADARRQHSRQTLRQHTMVQHRQSELSNPRSRATIRPSSPTAIMYSAAEQTPTAATVHAAVTDATREIS